MSSEPDAPDRIGEILLGKLRVVRRLGGGGMGDVFEVEHLITRHRRAIKIVRAEYARQRRFMERLLREASIAGRLRTPHVVETLDAGTLEDGSAYILMELLEGISLHDMIRNEGTLTQRRCASIMCQVAEGIGVAHAAGIVHRDLKPENVFIVLDEEDGSEQVKILDFGVSKILDVHEDATRLTREGTVLGTPFYMAPEQAAGRTLDARTDVWAMGVIMYEALTGKLPFVGQTIGEVFIAIGAGHYPPLSSRRPDLDAAFVSIVDRALRTDPEARYPSAEAMRRDLLPFAGHDSLARAKTISDGAGTRRQEAPPIPRPAPLPARLELTPTAESAQAPAEPAPETPCDVRAEARPPRGVGERPAREGAWMVAGAIVLAVGVAALIAWSSSHEPRAQGRAFEPRPAPVAEPPEVPPPASPGARPAAGAAAATEPLPVAGAPVVGAPDAQPADGLDSSADASARRPARSRSPGAWPRGRLRTRAERAGLEGNPYGQR